MTITKGQQHADGQQQGPTAIPLRNTSALHTVLALILFNMCYVIGPLIVVSVPLYLVVCTSLWWLGVLLITTYLYLSFDGSERNLGSPAPQQHNPYLPTVSSDGRVCVCRETLAVVSGSVFLPLSV